ncbi:hypothetical protein T439DRAFT_323429 [Meredithblackwellia eburnea MCA 4105]
MSSSAGTGSTTNEDGGGASATSRYHIVLVPGFTGFDVLGQIQYYPAINELLTTWQQQQYHPTNNVNNTGTVTSNSSAHRVQLHHFDSLPTSGVQTRADRLLYYLLKLISTNTVNRSSNDKIILLGHSTGGLDIRSVFRTLTQLDQRELLHSADGQFSIQASELIDIITRFVFLSVPQRGTGIANWVIQVTLLRWSFLGIGSVFTRAASKLPIRWLWSHTPSYGFVRTHAPGIFHASNDAFAEMNYTQFPSWQKIKIANAREAAAEFSMWFENMFTDFGAIDDLAFVKPEDRKHVAEEGWVSPAQITDQDRKEEEDSWEDRIKTLSFATLGTRPFPKWDWTKNAPVLHWWNFCHLWKLFSNYFFHDFLYLFVYWATASLPFDLPNVPGPVTVRNIDGEVEEVNLARWDNDGIVNTASMLWPNGEDTILVHGDHGDIIGHYKLQRESPRVAQIGSPREFFSYDIFGSKSGFNDERFQKVWFKIFEFATTA